MIPHTLNISTSLLFLSCVELIDTYGVEQNYTRFHIDDIK